MTKYAAWSAAQLLMVAVLVTAEAYSYVGLAVLGISIPMFWAWGAFHADIAMNESLDETTRSRWRIAFWCVPGAMALYWYRHVRSHRWT